jgi:hypothetical protein
MTEPKKEFGILRVLTVLGLLIALIPAFYFYGQLCEKSAMIQALTEKGSLTSELDKAQTMSEFSKLSLQQQVEKNIALEKENRELRDKVISFSESLSTTNLELQKVHSRINELSRYGAVEIFETQFLITLFDVYEDTSSLSNPDWKTFVNVSFQYIGEDGQNNSDKYRYNSAMRIGETMDIYKGGRKYIIRLLSIDPQNRKATFSHYMEPK